MIIISRNNKVLFVWNAIHIVACLVSSYMYAYLAAFSEKGGETFNEIIIGFEIIFFISFCLNFITDYKEEGAPNPVRDIALISMRYMQTRFI